MTTERAEPNEPYFDADEGKEEAYLADLAREAASEPGEPSPEAPLPSPESGATAEGTPPAPTAAPEGEIPAAPTAETPSEPAPVAEPPEVVQLRQRNAELLREQAERQEQMEQQRMSAALGELEEQARRQYEAQGYAPEQAQTEAARQRASQEGMLQERQRHTREMRGLERKTEMALELGHKHGVNPKDLMAFDSPHSMEAAASQQATVSALQKEVTQLKQERVAPTTVSTNRTSSDAAPSRDRRLDQYNNGDWRPRTEAEWRELEQLLQS